MNLTTDGILYDSLIMTDEYIVNESNPSNIVTGIFEFIPDPIDGSDILDSGINRLESIVGQDVLDSDVEILEPISGTDVLNSTIIRPDPVDGSDVLNSKVER